MRLLPLLLLFVIACTPRPQTVTDAALGYDQSEALAALAGQENERMRFKLIASRTTNRAAVWQTVDRQLNGFGAKQYDQLRPLILEQDIPTLQNHVANRLLTYPDLVKWYLYRIRSTETDPARSLHTILQVNPDAVARAQELQANRPADPHPLYGIPVLLKDNINAAGMPTTAGAELLKNHTPGNAFIVDRIEARGGLILGKVNLSEWAYYFCGGCPLGYSAVGGQTLNPYGPRVFETGGSSAGSGTAVAVNYAPVAVGTETAGSILSPSAQNSVVGLKPTIGLLSRTGIVPISYTLDTPGPMAKSVTDAAILLDALRGEDGRDFKSVASLDGYALEPVRWDTVRLAYFRDFVQNERYAAQIERLRTAGATLVEVQPEPMDYDGFTRLLDGEMKRALPEYLATYASSLPQRTVADVVEFNRQDTFRRAPYNQSIFEGIVADEQSDAELETLQRNLKNRAVAYLKPVFDAQRVHAILSINNYSAAAVALAEYPALAVPMGYTEAGEPQALTFIGRPWTERRLLNLGVAFEGLGKQRRIPKGYR